MTRPALAVFEGNGTDGYSAFSPDLPGTGELGDTLEEARQGLLECMGYWPEESSSSSRSLNASRGSIDFAELDPQHVGRYLIQWIDVEIPATTQAAVAE